MVDGVAEATAIGLGVERRLASVAIGGLEFEEKPGELLVVRDGRGERGTVKEPGDLGERLGVFIVVELSDRVGHTNVEGADMEIGYPEREVLLRCEILIIGIGVGGDKLFDTWVGAELIAKKVQAFKPVRWGRVPRKAFDLRQEAINPRGERG